MQEMHCKHINIFFYVLILVFFIQVEFVFGNSISVFDDVSKNNNEIIKNKLNFYNDKFKDIQFIHLDGGDDWKEELGNILKLLGKNPVALDYEHPKELRHKLMYVTIKRMQLILEGDIVSSTLFRVNDKDVNQRTNLCVVSLNPQVVSKDDFESMRYMLDYTDKIINKIHPSRYLDTHDYLNFLLDHEFYHCLDSFLFGGSPIVHKRLGGEYNKFRRESAADAFALIMYLKKYGALNDFARNILHIRSLSMLNNPSHHTTKTMIKVANINIESLSKMKFNDVIIFSKRLADITVGSYSDFIDQQANELMAIKYLGYNAFRNENMLNELDDVTVDLSSVENLVKYYQFFYMKLFTNDKIDYKSIELPY